MIEILKCLESNQAPLLFSFLQMSTNRFIAIVTLGLAIAFVVVQLTNGQPDMFGHYSEKRQDKASHKYCGRHLSDALQLLCNGVYNAMFKKSGQG